MKIAKTLLLLSATVLLAGCGGGGGSSSQTKSESKISTTSAEKSSEASSEVSSSEESSSEESSSASPTEFVWYVTGDMVNWGVDSAWGLTKNTQSQDDEYMGTFLFPAGTIWKICNADQSVWNQNFKTGEGSAIDAGQMELVDDGLGGKNCQVKTEGTYTMYYKVDGGDPGVWITANAE